MTSLIGVTHALYPNEIKNFALLCDSLFYPMSSQYLNRQSFDDLEMYARIKWLFENKILVDRADSLSFSIPELYNALLAYISQGVNISAIESNLDEFLLDIKAWQRSRIPKMSARDPDMIFCPSGALQLPGKSAEERTARLFELMQSIPEPMARITSAWMRQHLHMDAVALIPKPQENFLRSFPTTRVHAEPNRNDVLSLVIDKLPKPDDTVPWEQIVDFRNDDESRQKLRALRRWTHKVARDSLSYQELNDELEWLLNEYESHLKLIKMKYKLGTMETIVTTNTLAKLRGCRGRERHMNPPQP